MQWLALKPKSSRLTSMGRSGSILRSLLGRSEILRSLAIRCSSQRLFPGQCLQSSRWVDMIISNAECTNRSTSGLRVWTFIPALTGVVQAVTGRVYPSMWTIHSLQRPEGGSCCSSEHRLGIQISALSKAQSSRWPSVAWMVLSSTLISTRFDVTCHPQWDEGALGEYRVAVRCARLRSIHQDRHSCTNHI